MTNGQAKPPASLADSSARLRRLERQDWWRWGCFVAITVLLAAGVSLLSTPLKRNVVDQGRLDVMVATLFGLVLLFDLFALYQQVLIGRLRREVSSHLGMPAALETLTAEGEEWQDELTASREFQRFQFDQRIAVSAARHGKLLMIHGRTTDLGDGGVGAVLPEPLELGNAVTVEINLAREEKLVARSLVCYRRGFHHGFAFRGLSSEQLEAIHQACEGALPFFDLRGMPNLPPDQARRADRT